MTDRAYSRISLDTLVSGSIDKQRASLTKSAGADVVFYEDRSTSGSVPFDERPDGARLLADLRPGDRVLVTKIDRAARNVRDLLNLVERIEKAGATIIFTEQEGIDNTPVGGLMLKILAAVAEFERELIAERRRESLAAFKVDGRHAVGRAPFGLQSVPNPNGRGLVLRPYRDETGEFVGESATLRDVVARLLGGEAQAALAEVVGMGAPAFSRLLRNDRLAGVLEQRSDGPRLDPDMAVFSLVEWSRLQDHLTRPEKAWSRADGFGAALACGVCGDRLYLNKSKRDPAYATYRCRKAQGHDDGEPGATVIAANADPVVEDEFLRRFGAEPVTEEITTDSSAARDEAIALAKMRLEAAQKSQREARTREERREAAQAVEAALDALDDAEAMPTERVTEVRDTGMTHGELWAMLTDDSEKVAFLRSAGRWVVSPGRMPLAEKVVFEPA